MLLAVLLVGLAVFSDAAPRSKSKGPQLVYDQKQHGDYNIQVHLKDFQIIALLGEESLGLGDYDYNYDYADFTVKPSGPSSSPKPTQEISTTTLKASEVHLTSTKPSEQPSTTLKPHSEEADIKPSTTSKPLGVLGEEKPAEQEPSLDVSTTKKDELTPSTEKISETTEKNIRNEPMAVDAIPGQIQVQVFHSPEGYPNMSVRKDETEEKGSAGKSNDKKCLTGYSRDKRGRCRRIQFW
ncbi:uncharacterized protein LOC123313622 isoform X2 [Coccinella septempunctata]|uniref:uncharacterized protein LOC123313622 isoform X2 n=1 Tax=Coccinella septempunctata TaxID=41139 RepID=UPI001D07C16A|nr:uncharacterized protein LOC123313622 isoform X2 [Coccinella septempunctata]